ncbi:cytochrome P450 [Xylaria bambusicola]|uniref:cytochrome P450 n=1 Tax=Xylaria bambusicola TaxID=326684 RepID=UPI002008A005|nr:cytochrome P450 [Xylaria bambusicola]KAI0512990.1 cytochrome P450 [Xylaria bambusicola]
MLLPLLLTSLIALGTYLYITLRYKRFSQYAHIPQFPSSLLLGHLKTMDEYIRRIPADGHTDIAFTAMHEKLGRPPLFLIDTRPFSIPAVIVTNHDIAEQVAKASAQFPASAPKPTFKYLEHLIGSASILSSEEDQWKALRKRYSPGFAPQHLVTLLPSILDKIVPFVKHLDSYADKEETFALVPLITNLTFDIIGSVIMDSDLDAQNPDPAMQGELVRRYIELLVTYNDDKADIPWWLTPMREMKRYRLSSRVDELIKDTIRHKFAEQRGASASQKSRSILALSLGDAESLTPELVNVTCDQLKTFLIAGHDTTSVMLAWVFYELSLNPQALAAVRAELDSLLGPDTDPEAVRARFLSPEGPEIVQKMPYVSAVIKEALRLHPPAATARYTKPGTGFTVRAPTGEEYCLDGVIIYNCTAIMHRDPDVYGDTADRFVPERWLHDGGAGSNVPASAWRPFERGPRNCIGQEFANIEARVIIAHIARRYDFTKVGMGEVLRDEKGQPVIDGQGCYTVVSSVYKTRQVTAKPADGMKVKVARRD